MDAHIGVDVASGLTDHVVTTPDNTHDITEAENLPHHEEDIVIADIVSMPPPLYSPIKISILKARRKHI